MDQTQKMHLTRWLKSMGAEKWGSKFYVWTKKGSIIVFFHEVSQTGESKFVSSTLKRGFNFFLKKRRVKQRRLPTNFINIQYYKLRHRKVRWGNLGLTHSFVYTSGHCCRWRSRLEVKIMAGSLFVHCKIAYLYSVTAEKCLVVSLPNFVTIRRTHLPISCKIFSWISTTKLKIHAMEFCDFIKDSVRPSGLLSRGLVRASRL